MKNDEFPVQTRRRSGGSGTGKQDPGEGETSEALALGAKCKGVPRNSLIKINDIKLIRTDTTATAQQRKQSTTLNGNLLNGRRYLQITYLIVTLYPKSIKNLKNSTPPQKK